MGNSFLPIMVVLAALLIGANQFLLAGMNERFESGSAAAASPVATAAPPANDQPAVANSPEQAKALQLAAEVVPKGAPAYGAQAGVSYDAVDSSLEKLVAYHTSVALTPEQQQRYLQIGTTAETGCGYCCGVGNRGFLQADGNLICGCGHNIGLSGLAKWMLANTDYSNEQILDAISKWKGVFFPGPKLRDELVKAGLSPALVGMPEQQGGC